MPIKTRKLYVYPCTRCGKKAQSLKAERAIDQLCRPCRKVAAHGDQQTLFEKLDTEPIRVKEYHPGDPIKNPFI
jgi:hypothetical protein